MATRALEQRVNAVEETVAGLQNLPNQLAEFRRETNARFDRLEQRMAKDKERLEQRMATDRETLEQRMAADRETLEQRMAADKEELYTHMRVLHEELVDRIKTIRGGRDSGQSSRRRRKK
jgi:prophage DNA circulation protein